MTARKRDVDRKVVPRLHGLAAASEQGEIASARSDVLTDPRDDEAARELLRELREDWETHRSPAFASDLVGAALVLDNPAAAEDAARFLLESHPAPLADRIARRLLDLPIETHELIGDSLNEGAVRAEIRILKASVRRDPRAALLWAELSRRYASLGQKEKAAQAMALALALAPHNRFILRSAARLHLHLDQPDRAHNLLSGDAATPRDPWLVAAEIATAPLAGRRSKLIKHGRRLLESGRFYPNAVSELASALGTEALAAGSDRDARRLFETSLNEPTENAVAQAGWAASRGARVEISEHLLEDVQGTFEARAQFRSKEGDTDRALQSTWDWLRSEPFAANPAVFGSFEASLVRRYDEAIRFAQIGLLANPDEFFLRNNLAFALASDDRLDAAIANLDRIDESKLNDEELQYLTATRGLIAFRTGDHSSGRLLYRQAMEKSKDPGFRAIAGLMLLREEIAAHTSVGAATALFAQELIDTARGSRSADDQRLPMWVLHVNAEAGREVLSAPGEDAPQH